MMDENREAGTNQGEELQQPEEGLVLDGRSWRDKNSTTYTSILDLYGMADLFTEKTTGNYEGQLRGEQELQEQLREFVFSGSLQQEEEYTALVDYVFSDTLVLSRVREYTTGTEDYTVSLILAGILAVLVFGMAVAQYNRKRRKRREQFAAEIDMEVTGAEKRSKSAGIG